MYSIEVLFTLIRTMSKSEKRYFQMFSDMQKGEKNYLVLFNYLDKHEVFDDALLRGLKEKFPGNTIEAARKHLYTVIMKSLRTYDADKDTETRLMNLLQESRILYDKGLVKMSIDQLGKIKALSLRHEKFNYYILAARRELQYLVRSQFNGIDEYELLEKQKAITEMIEQGRKIHNHTMLYEVLLLRYWKNGMARSQRDVTRLNDLLLEEYQLLNSSGKKPFELLKMHLNFQSIYFQMTGNANESLKVFRELESLFQQHQELWKDAPIYYFHLLDGILFDLRSMARYSEMDYFLQRLKAMPTSGEALAGIIKLRALEYELNRHVDQERYEEAQQLLDQSLPAITRELSLLPFPMYSRFTFTRARVHMATGNYSTALRTINSALSKSTNAMNQSQLILFQLINLQVNALLNNTDYLVYAIRSVERKLKSERKLRGVEQLLISLLKRHIAIKPIQLEIKEQVAELEDNPYERLLMKELCLKEWIRRLPSSGQMV